MWRFKTLSFDMGYDITSGIEVIVAHVLNSRIKMNFCIKGIIDKVIYLIDDLLYRLFCCNHNANLIVKTEH